MDGKTSDGKEAEGNGGNEIGVFKEDDFLVLFYLLFSTFLVLLQFLVYLAHSMSSGTLFAAISRTTIVGQKEHIESPLSWQGWALLFVLSKMTCFIG